MLTLNDEIKAQQNALFLNAIITGSCAILAATVGFCGHGLIAGLLLFIGCGYFLHQRNEMQNEFAARTEDIVFKQQVLHLYCYSQYPSDPDVFDRAKSAAMKLHSVGNTHGVIVFSIVYKSVFWHGITVGANGQFVVSRYDVPNEVLLLDYEGFKAAVQIFVHENDIKRKRHLESKKTFDSVEWVNHFLYNQN
jgi:hypothetical protein